MTSPSLTSSGSGRSRSPRRVEEHHAAVADAAISRGDLALRPEGHARDIALLDLQRRRLGAARPGRREHHAAAAAAHIPRRSCPPGPKATLLTSPSLTSSGSGRSRSPRASKSTTPPRAADAAISRGDLALRPEGHAPDIALLDLQRRGSEPLAPGVEEHHAAAADAARHIPRRSVPSGPEGHARDIALLDLQRRGSEPLPPGVEEHHAAAAAADAAISRGDLALRPEGHAPDTALLDLQRRGSEPLAPGVEEHHAAAAAAAHIPRRSCPPARRPRS